MPQAPAKVRCSSAAAAWVPRFGVNACECPLRVYLGLPFDFPIRRNTEFGSLLDSWITSDGHRALRLVVSSETVETKEADILPRVVVDEQCRGDLSDDGAEFVTVTRAGGE